MTGATSRLIRECRLLGAANVIVSTNVAVRRDGLPYARQRTPEDPGAAVYFKLESVPEGLVLACDRWLRVEDNIAAVAAHIGPSGASTAGAWALSAKRSPDTSGSPQAMPRRPGGKSWESTAKRRRSP